MNTAKQQELNDLPLSQRGYTREGMGCRGSPLPPPQGEKAEVFGTHSSNCHSSGRPGGPPSHPDHQNNLGEPC